MKRNLSVRFRTVRFCLTLLVALCVALLWASPAKAGTTLTGPCPVVITQPGEYNLGADLTCLLGVDGIDILVSQVTLHLDGHTITGACGTGTGIHVLGTPLIPLSMVRILGTGTISTFTRNFVADYSAGSFVKFVTVASQCFQNYGFLISTSSSQWKLDGDIVIAPETSFGVVLFGTDNEVVRSNISDTISVSNNNVIVNNTASDNLGGIFVFGSNNDIHANTTDNNSAGDGIDVIVGALGNNITGNTAENNHPFDLEDDNPNCGTNKWEGNRFGLASQPCIQ